MSISETERHEIYESLKNQHGERVASNLMSMLPPIGWADVATKTDLSALEAKLEGRMDRLEGRMDGFSYQLDAMAADLRTEMHQSIRNQTWALVAWTTALAGLLVAIGR